MKQELQKIYFIAAFVIACPSKSHTMEPDNRDKETDCKIEGAACIAQSTPLWRERVIESDKETKVLQRLFQKDMELVLPQHCDDNDIHRAARHAPENLKIIFHHLQQTMPLEDYQQKIQSVCFRGKINTNPRLYGPVHNLLACACIHIQPRSVKFLLQQGFDPNSTASSPNSNLQDFYEVTPLEFAVFGDDAESPHADYQGIRQIIALLRLFKADMNAPSTKPFVQRTHGKDTKQSRTMTTTLHLRKEAAKLMEAYRKNTCDREYTEKKIKQFLELATIIEQPDQSIFGYINSLMSKKKHQCSYLFLIPAELLKLLQGFILYNYPWEHCEERPIELNARDRHLLHEQSDKCLIH